MLDDLAVEVSGNGLKHVCCAHLCAREVSLLLQLQKRQVEYQLDPPVLAAANVRYRIHQRLEARIRHHVA